MKLSKFTLKVKYLMLVPMYFTKLNITNCFVNIVDIFNEISHVFLNHDAHFVIAKHGGEVL